MGRIDVESNQEQIVLLFSKLYEVDTLSSVTFDHMLYACAFKDKFEDNFFPFYVDLSLGDF